MNATLLIDAIVRQTTVLIAQLATSGGLRAPLAHVANQVFLDLAGELDAQGVSRKVSADMFGMALRAYRKKIQRLSESSTERGRSLWESVLEYLEQHELRTRQDVLLHFCNDDETQVRGVLHDLVESGLVFSSGSQSAAVYRCTSSEERHALQQSGAGLEELVWALIYREGRRSPAELAQSCGRSEADLLPLLESLRAQRRVERLPDGSYRAQSFVIPLGSETGWEGAVFDHYHAVVRTLCMRLRSLPQATSLTDTVGGSTYSYKIWPHHPHHDEVLAMLRRLREELSALRTKVEHWNDEQGAPAESLAVTVYVGQCAVEQCTEQPADPQGSPAQGTQPAEDGAKTEPPTGLAAPNPGQASALSSQNES